MTQKQIIIRKHKNILIALLILSLSLFMSACSTNSDSVSTQNFNEDLIEKDVEIQNVKTSEDTSLDSNENQDEKDKNSTEEATKLTDEDKDILAQKGEGEDGLYKIYPVFELPSLDLEPHEPTDFSKKMNTLT